MSHFAKLDENNVVTFVIRARQESDGLEDQFTEQTGEVWKQTSYNTYGGVHYDPETGEPSEDQTKALRFNYAGIGFTYDEDRDAFIPPKPYDSWVLDEATCLWAAPIEYPADGGVYTWDESLGDWVEVVSETT
jgi:hypothetical protein